MKFGVTAFFAITGMWVVFAFIAWLLGTAGWWSILWFAAWLMVTSALVGWLHDEEVKKDGNTKKSDGLQKVRKASGRSRKA